MKKESAVFNWSGGKDSALTLYQILKEGSFDIETLLTNVNGHHQRVSMHGVRVELLELQAKHLGLPLQMLSLAEQPTMDEFDELTLQTYQAFAKKGINRAIFGDIFLEDLRQYRDELLDRAGFKCIYPLWKRDTTELVHEFIDLGFKTITVAVKSELMDDSFVGRVIDYDFLEELPEGVDPCGENGEFHTFTFDGPIFREPIPFSMGEKIHRSYNAPKDGTEHEDFDHEKNPKKMGFWFCDLIPG